MRKRIEPTGFTPPSARPLGRERRTAAVAELLATIGLILGTVIAATAITAGAARADIAGSAAGHGTGTAVAVLLAAVFLGMAGLTALSLAGERRKRRGG